MIEHGVYTIVIGDEEAEHWLRSAPEQVDDMLYELVDSIVFHASDRLRLHAPGSISLLVDVDLPHEPEPRRIDGAAGVLPAATGGRGRVDPEGSDPADFPVYVEVGTGIYGERESPIFARHGHAMGPFEHLGREVFAKSILGQPAQHYARQAWEDTISWTPGRIELARAEFYAKAQAYV